MFHTESARVRQFDQLQPWRIYRLSREVADAVGIRWPAGTEFRFTVAEVNLAQRRALIHGLGPAGEPLVFESNDNAHRWWFSDTGREWREAPPPPPAVVDAGPAPDGQALVDRVRGLGHVEAAAVLASAQPSPGWHGARQDADTLSWAAKALQHTHPALSKALAQRAVDGYCAWMSQATSGGEGAAMRREVHSDLERAEQLARRSP